MEKKQKLRDKTARFHRLFTTHDGEQVLKDLEDEFDSDDLKGATNADTNYNVGRRDVIVYIRQMMRFEENARRTELEG